MRFSGTLVFGGPAILQWLFLAVMALLCGGWASACSGRLEDTPVKWLFGQLQVACVIGSAIGAVLLIAIGLAITSAVGSHAGAAGVQLVGIEVSGYFRTQDSPQSHGQRA